MRRASSPTAGPSTPAAPDPGRRTTLWRHHDFRRLWVGDTISQVGTQLTGLAIPVLAVQVLRAGEREMGVLVAMETLAFLLIGLPAGAWVDRWNKRLVLVAGDVVRAVVLASLPLAWWLDALTLVQMYAVALVVGVATVFFDVAYQSYLPSIVDARHLVEGNAKLEASRAVAQVGGPAAGGALLRVASPVALIGADALSFLASALFVARIRHRDQTPDRPARRRLRVEIAEGLSFVLRHRLLRRIVACTSLSNLFSAMTFALFTLLVLRDLDLSPATLGLIFSVSAVGGLAGALVAERFARWVGEGRAIPLSALGWIPFGALTPLAAVLAPQVPPAPVLVVGGFGAWFWVVVYNITQVSFRQRVCPPALLGRMNASVRFIVWGTQPIGALAGGLVAAGIGMIPTLLISAVGMSLATLPVVASPLLRMRDLPASPEG